jgi:hypothetical protein
MSAISDCTKIFRDAKDLMQRSDVAALNRAVRSAFSATSKFIRQTYNIKFSNLDALKTITTANKNNPICKLIISHKSIQASKFTPIYQSFSGTFFKEKLGPSRYIPHAFILKIKGETSSGDSFSHTGITLAKYVSGHGKSRKYKWTTIWGPSGEQLLSSKIAQEFLQQKFEERFQIEFKRAWDQFSK